MGDWLHHHQAVAKTSTARQHYHPAVDGVIAILSKANRDLSVIQLHIEHEFQAIYSDQENPCKLISRIKKIQEELVSLKDLCQELLKEKQDLIDQVRVSLCSERSSLNRLLGSSGLPLKNNSDDLAYTNLSQIIDEWKLQLKRRVDEKDIDEDDINQLLFSAVVNNN